VSASGEIRASFWNCATGAARCMLKGHGTSHWRVILVRFGPLSSHLIVNCERLDLQTRQLGSGNCYVMRVIRTVKFRLLD
jgi:hypothetical protein